MKKIIVSLCITATVLQARSQSVAINTDGTLADSKAILDIKSTTKGLLIPRMTTAQRNAMGPPPNGLMVFDINYSNYFFSSGGSWNQIGTGSNFWSVNGQGAIYSVPPYTVGIGTTIPYSRFHVNGTSWFQGDNTPLPADAGQGIAIGYASIGYIFGYDYSNNLPKDLILQHPGGNVGIGTTSPIGKLHILHSGPTGHLVLESPELDQYSTIVFTNTGSNTTWGIEATVRSSEVNDKLNFYHSTWGAVMSITGQGKVGIGTSAPVAKLHVNASNEAIRLSGSSPYLSFFDGSNNYKGYLWQKGSNDIELGTAVANTFGNVTVSMKGTPYLTIQNNGQVNIGTAGPSVLFNTSSHSLTATNGVVLKSNSSNQFQDEWKLNVNVTSGSLVIWKNGTSNAYIDGNGDYNTYSDVSLKDNFSAYKAVLPDIQKLQIATYNYKSDKSNKKSFGLIAQNVAEYYPEIVSRTTNETGIELLGIAYGKTGVLALKAIQEQQAVINKQQYKIEELEKRLQALERR